MNKKCCYCLKEKSPEDFDGDMDSCKQCEREIKNAHHRAMKKYGLRELGQNYNNPAYAEYMKERYG